MVTDRVIQHMENLKILIFVYPNNWTPCKNQKITFLAALKFPPRVMYRVPCRKSTHFTYCTHFQFLSQWSQMNNFISIPDQYVLCLITTKFYTKRQGSYLDSFRLFKDLSGKLPKAHENTYWFINSRTHYACATIILKDIR